MYIISQLLSNSRQFPSTHQYVEHFEVGAGLTYFLSQNSLGSLCFGGVHQVMTHTIAPLFNCTDDSRSRRIAKIALNIFTSSSFTIFAMHALGMNIPLSDSIRMIKLLVGVELLTSIYGFTQHIGEMHEIRNLLERARIVLGAANQQPGQN